MNKDVARNKIKAVFLLLVMAALLSLILYFEIGYFNQKLDLYKKGVLVSGVILDNKKTTNYKIGNKQNIGSVEAGYLYRITYAGNKKYFESAYEISDNQLLIYYSPESPDNAIIATSRHPYKHPWSVIDANDLWMIGGIIAALIGIAWAIKTLFSSYKPISTNRKRNVTSSH